MSFFAQRVFYETSIKYAPYPKVIQIIRPWKIDETWKKLTFKHYYYTRPST